MKKSHHKKNHPLELAKVILKSSPYQKQAQTVGFFLRYNELFVKTVGNSQKELQRNRNEQWFRFSSFNINSFESRRQCGSVVRVGDLNVEDPGSNPRLGLLNVFVLGDPRGNFTMLCK